MESRIINSSREEECLFPKIREYELDITFFIPCLNEAANIKATVETIIKAVKQFPLNYEILVVDDASTDGTQEILRSIVKENPESPIRFILNAKHRGLGFNYYRGAFFAKGKHYMLVNGDNVESVDAIVEIIKYCGKSDIIIPFFVKDKRSVFRRVTSVLFKTITDWLSGNKINYYNGPVLHLTDNVVLWRSETLGYGYQAELLCRLLHEKASYTEVAVPHTDRQRGFSKAFSLSNFLSVANSLLHIFWRRMEYGVFKLLSPGMTDQVNDVNRKL